MRSCGKQKIVCKQRRPREECKLFMVPTKPEIKIIPAFKINIKPNYFLILNNIKRKAISSFTFKKFMEQLRMSN
jgi:hypothetical protein